MRVTRDVLFAGGLALAVGVAVMTSSASSHPPYNPTVTQATIDSTICVPGWTDTVRPPVDYTNKLKADAIAKLPSAADHDPFHYEEDHVVPLALGGAPANPANLTLEPIVEAHRKDTLERGLQLAVCAHNLTLDQGRYVFTHWRFNP